MMVMMTVVMIMIAFSMLMLLLLMMIMMLMMAMVAIMFTISIINNIMRIVIANHHGHYVDAASTDDEGNDGVAGNDCGTW